MKMQHRQLSALGFALGLLAACHSAPPPSAPRGRAPPLHAPASIGAAAATRTALRRVPGGTVLSADLEEEGGKLLYSLDIRPQGDSGVEEVQIDAHSGAVLSQQHESPTQEADETRHEDTVLGQ